MKMHGFVLMCVRLYSDRGQPFIDCALNRQAITLLLTSFSVFFFFSTAGSEFGLCIWVGAREGGRG